MKIKSLTKNVVKSLISGEKYGRKKEKDNAFGRLFGRILVNEEKKEAPNEPTVKDLEARMEIFEQGI